ncbi:carbohydrate kinase [Aeromicrobium sp. NPDC092404]|uniref:carbohydrate kinase family protein n=1 Tax=Aeromicrobium sp. NPDC092404 TaxID=3154976 RepID=UPI00341DD176
MTALIVGEALVDVVQRAGAAAEPHAGGSPFNVAVGLSRLDVPVRLAAQLADDAHGDLLRSRLRESGVLLDALEPTPERTSSARATLADDGSATYDFDLTWDPATLPDPGEFEVVHVGSLGTSLPPGAALVADLVVMADAVGVPVSFDPNVRLAVQPDHAVWRRTFEAIAPHAAIVKMSDEDAAVLFPDEDLEDLAVRLAAGGTLVAITLGGEGAIIAASRAVARIDAPRVTVVDTIGAGDSFMAAVLSWCAAYSWPAAGELDRTELTDLGMYACSAAAITCSRPGADPPRTADLTP